MSDPLTCPQCEGRKVEKIGPLSLACLFCHGRGTVGGTFEPAEDRQERTDGFRDPVDGETYDPAIHGPLPSVGAHPAVRGTGLCPECLGARTVIHGPHMRSEPCPSCT